jgi:hypothetical protein
VRAKHVGAIRDGDDSGDNGLAEVGLGSDKKPPDLEKMATLM